MASDVSGMCQLVVAALEHGGEVGGTYEVGARIGDIILEGC